MSELCKESLAHFLQSQKIAFLDHSTVDYWPELCKESLARLLQGRIF